jgi:hypothetical protein
MRYTRQQYILHPQNSCSSQPGPGRTPHFCATSVKSLIDVAQRDFGRDSGQQRCEICSTYLWMSHHVQLHLPCFKTVILVPKVTTLQAQPQLGWWSCRVFKPGWLRTCLCSCAARKIAQVPGRRSAHEKASNGTPADCPWSQDPIATSPAVRQARLLLSSAPAPPVTLHFRQRQTPHQTARHACHIRGVGLTLSCLRVLAAG